ncbi:MAG: hypothetical protein QXZ56_05140 [Sulfolobales archaeon]
MRYRVCSFSKFDLEVRGDIDRVFDDILRWVGGFTVLDELIYFRATLKARTTSLDIMRFTGRASKLPNLLLTRVKTSIFYELLNELIKSTIIKSSLELIVSALPFNTLVGTYLGDLYLSEVITPVSYALTSLEIRNDLECMVFDEVLFNVCAVSKDFRIIGCLIPHTSKHVDLNVLQSVVASLRGIINDLNTQRKTVTWILSQDELYVVDY